MRSFPQPWPNAMVLHAAHCKPRISASKQTIPCHRDPGLWISKEFSVVHVCTLHNKGSLIFLPISEMGRLLFKQRMLIIRAEFHSKQKYEIWPRIPPCYRSDLRETIIGLELFFHHVYNLND